MLQIKEDPLHPGTYLGVDAPEFATHASGMIISMSVPPGTNADSVQVKYVTNPETANVDATPSIAHTGFYRDPLPLGDGTLVVAHASTTLTATNVGTRAAPASTYNYRLKTMKSSGGYWLADQSDAASIIAAPERYRGETTKARTKLAACRLALAKAL